jgi:polysaccharide pyruvyl transferase WcaK-like protein
VLAPDIAFRHQGALPEVGSSLLSSLGVNLDARPIIGLTPNMRIYYRTNGEGRTNDYVRFMTEIGRYCIEKWNATLVLIPHEITAADRPKVDDRYLCGLIELSLANPHQCVSITENYSSDQMKSVIGHLDMVIGSRFHSLVFALSSSVPVVAVGWAHKYSELMELFGLQGNVLEHDRLDWDAMRHMLENAWLSRGATREHLAGRLPNITGQIDEVFDGAATAITGRSH